MRPAIVTPETLTEEMVREHWKWCISVGDANGANDCRARFDRRLGARSRREVKQRICISINARNARTGAKP